MAARAGVEPTTLRLRVIASTNAPPDGMYVSEIWSYLNISEGCILSFRQLHQYDNLKNMSHEASNLYCTRLSSVVI